MSKSKKAAATAALLGEPLSSGADASASSSSSEPKKKKVKKEEGSVALDKRILNILSNQASGMSQDDVCSSVGLPAEEIIDTINDLLQRRRINLLQDGAGRIFYKYVSAEQVEKLRGLSASEMLIYQLVEKSGNLGIWIKDLRRKSSLSALEIPKLLKELMKRKLIKCEKSIAATNKKVYMLYDIEPAREVSGGAWYDKQTGEFDTEYMKALEEAMMMFLEKKHARRLAERERINRGALAPDAATEIGAATPGECADFLTQTGAFNTVPTEDETERILEGLVLEGRVERREDEREEARNLLASGKSSAAASSSSIEPPSKKRQRSEDISYVYRFIPAGAFQSQFAAIPCATCPVAHTCHDGNPVSPKSCEYLAEWLKF